MSNKKVITTVLLVTLIFIAPLNVFAEGTSDEEFNQEVDKFIGVMEAIENIYVYEIDDKELMEGAIKGLFYNMDPYSEYFTEEEFKQFKSNLSGEFAGIGIYISTKDNKVIIEDVIENTPASEGGLKKGDKIISVDGIDLTDKSSKNAADLLQGKEGSKVKVGIKRKGEDNTLYFTLQREKIRISSTEHKIIDGNIGYIKIKAFSDKTFGEVYGVVSEFDKKNIDEIIIDVRDNPGGYLDEVVNISKLFIPGGPIVHTRDYTGNMSSIRSSQSADYDKYELAVLVNGNSASASEIFAGAVKDTDVGTIIGTQTFGKGSVQSIMPLADGSGMRITTAEYLTPNKNRVNTIGITPDIIVENELEPLPVTETELSFLDGSREVKLGEVGLDVLAMEKSLDLMGYEIENFNGIFEESDLAQLFKFKKDYNLGEEVILDSKTQQKIVELVPNYIEPTIIDNQLNKAIEILKNN